LVRHVFTFNHFKAIFQLRCAAHSLSWRRLLKGDWFANC
jgi:hypothetical protein